ncbi:MAG: M14 family metallopeptidase [Gemmatimonadaceae bacterium]|nr:M14 family metallopeptidase [Gemmatimonadaceae bacterium]
MSAARARTGARARHHATLVRTALACAALVACAPSRPAGTPAPADSAAARRTADSLAEARERRRIGGEMVRTQPRTPRAAWQCASQPVRPLPVPATRAERTGFCETSSSADVATFLAELRPRVAAGRTLVVDTIGTTTAGRPLLRAVACGGTSCPDLVRAPARPVLWLQGNIHGGEVEGKEAALALLRDLVASAAPNALDSLVLVVVPNYNADGNDALAPQAVQRTEQHGPAIVGQRPNGANLDLNRDYIKAEAPETRAMLPWLARGVIDVFVDLHTTDGSYHGYALTWAPSLHPGAPLARFTQDTLLAGIRASLRARGVETFPYGNFSAEYGREPLTDSVKSGWWTYDHRPRFGTNYVGLTGGIAILSEAYSHDPFARRVEATRAFLDAIVSRVANDPSIMRRVRGTRAALAAGRGVRTLALASRLTTTPRLDTVLVEVLVADPDSSNPEPGVARGVRRTGRMLAQRMPVRDRFEVVQGSTLPSRGWVVERQDTALVALLRRHGVPLVAPVRSEELRGEEFVVDSLVQAARPFQGHREVRLTGRWRSVTLAVRGGHALVAAQLLEPESDDGAATWNVLDARLALGRPFPVRRIGDGLPDRGTRSGAARR